MELTEAEKGTQILIILSLVTHILANIIEI